MACALSTSDVRRVEEDDEHAIPGIGGRLERLPLRARLDALGLRSRRAHDDVLEGLDLLRHAVLEDLEVLGLQVEDRLAVLERIRVDPDEVRLDAEARRRLLLLSILSRTGSLSAGGFGADGCCGCVCPATSTPQDAASTPVVMKRGWSCMRTLGLLTGGKAGPESLHPLCAKPLAFASVPGAGPA